MIHPSHDPLPDTEERPTSLRECIVCGDDFSEDDGYPDPSNDGTGTCGNCLRWKWWKEDAGWGASE